MRDTTAYISISALKHNLQLVRQSAPDASVLAMVKADAYGHGIVAVAQALQNADGFGVATFLEGIQLRQAGIQRPIFLLQGLQGCDALDDLGQYQFIPVINSIEEAQILANEFPLDQSLSIWLKYDLGMHRLGLSTNGLSDVWALLSQHKNISIQGIIGHFSHITTNNEITQAQYDRFVATTRTYPVPKSLANSAAILSFGQSTLEWVRPGLMLYGACAIENKIGADYQLQPVMTLKAPIMAIHSVCAGETVGYDGIWRANQDTMVAVVAIGYGDGYPRAASNVAPVLVRGERTHVIGRVSMDMTMIDVSHISGVMIGDEVTLWGDGLPIEYVARACSTIPHDCLVGLTQRVPRIIV